MVKRMRIVGIMAFLFMDIIAEHFPCEFTSQALNDGGLQVLFGQWPSRVSYASWPG